jgi:hypothetical protein
MRRDLCAKTSFECLLNIKKHRKKTLFKKQIRLSSLWSRVFGTTSTKIKKLELKHLKKQ